MVLQAGARRQESVWERVQSKGLSTGIQGTRFRQCLLNPRLGVKVEAAG